MMLTGGRFADRDLRREGRCDGIGVDVDGTGSPSCSACRPLQSPFPPSLHAADLGPAAVRTASDRLMTATTPHLTWVARRSGSRIWLPPRRRRRVSSTVSYQARHGAAEYHHAGEPCHVPNTAWSVAPSPSRWRPWRPNSSNQTRPNRPRPSHKAGPIAFCFIPFTYIFISFRHNRRKEPLPAFTQKQPAARINMNHRHRRHANIA